MLREMGIRLWLPEDEPAPEASVVAATAAAAAIAEEAKPAVRSSSASSSVTVAAPAPRAAAVRAEEPQRLPGLAPADWLVVGDALDPADPQQQQLLENMLRAIGAGLVAPTRGRVHAHAGVPVVVTFAPAFLLRHPAEKAKAWADLCLAVGALSAS